MFVALLFAAATTALAATAGKLDVTDAVPSLSVPSCPATATLRYDKSVPDKDDFPETQVDLCYDATTIQITFTACNETNFHFNSSHTTNGPIYEYEVMEAFIAAGHDDPRTYFEFEVSPNNVTFNAFILNPSKVRAPGAPFGPALVTDPLVYGLAATTTLDRPVHRWVSTATIPLFLFNVDDGMGKGTKWRMNFFRTITSPETFPEQGLGAWNPPSEPNFHMTPFFGKVVFV